jgi:photosynthetic reaction center cytochrome c subunit
VLKSFLALGSCALLAAVPAIATEPARKTPSPDVPAEKFYKNIRVFQGLPSTELMPAMNFMANSLGVKCSFCHVTNDTGRWPVERDDKPTKGKAREMIRMMREINKANFKGHLEVTCATCHHGSNEPVSMPPLGSESAAAHTADSEAKPAEVPSVNAVLEKYTASIGGKDAIGRIRTRQIRGTFTGADGQGHPIQITQTSSGKYCSSVTVEEGSFTIVFDGASGSTGGPSWKNPMMPDEIERIKSRARLFPAADLKERFPALAVRRGESVDGREAWLVMARDASGGRVSFWFDAENGLLLRILQRQHTPLGDIPEQADYADYREVDGVKVPYTIRHTAPDRSDTVSATELKQNVDIDDAVFSPPKS